MNRNVSLYYLIMLNNIRYTISISSIFLSTFFTKTFWGPCRILEIESGRSIHQYWKHCSMWKRCRGIIPPYPKGVGSSVWISGSGTSSLHLIPFALWGTQHLGLRAEERTWQSLSLGFWWPAQGAAGGCSRAQCDCAGWLLTSGNYNQF